MSARRFALAVAICFSAVHFQNTAVVLDLVERRERWRAQCHGNHALLAFTPDGQRPTKGSAKQTSLASSRCPRAS
jgi:hypothetical protein